MKLTAQKALKSELSPYKKWQTKWSIAAGVVFPGQYSVAMSNLGFQSLYANLFEMDFVKPMRYLYDIDSSLDGDLQPGNLPILFFSIPFELSYSQALKMLQKWNIGLSPEERDENDPILVCGGAAPTLNPDVAGGIFDIVFQGDLLAVLGEIENSLRMLLSVNGRQAFIDKMNLANPLNHIHRIANRKPEFSRIVSSFAAFRNMFLVEIQKSCNFRCGFCATPFIYGDFQNFAKDDILKIIMDNNPGTNRIGLVGSAIAEHPELGAIIAELHQQGQTVSTSSIRMDRINPEVMDILKQSGANSITIAPETHVEKLYKKIGKHITAESIIESCKDLPFNEIKLYYIIGFREEDQDDIIELTDKIKSIAKALPRMRFSVSINPFIPKPGTRLCRDGMQSDKELKGKFKIIQKQLSKIKNIKLTVNYSHRQRLEALLALGDKKLAEILIESAKGRPIKNALKINGIDIKAPILPDSFTK